MINIRFSGLHTFADTPTKEPEEPEEKPEAQEKGKNKPVGDQQIFIVLLELRETGQDICLG